MSETIAEKLQTIAENVPKVFESGIEQGKQTEHDTFWDEFQNYGKRTKYYCAFTQQESSGVWNDETFKPKYDIKPVGDAYMLFRGTRMTDLAQILEDCGVTLDMSGATSIRYSFYSMSNVTRLPILDFSSVTTGASDLFGYNGKMHTIEKIIMPKSSSLQFGSTNFIGCSNLENITIEGTIYQNFNIGYCPKLTHDSLMSIINALATTSNVQLVDVNLKDIVSGSLAWDNGSDNVEVDGDDIIIHTVTYTYGNAGDIPNTCSGIEFYYYDIGNLLEVGKTYTVQFDSVSEHGENWGWDIMGNGFTISMNKSKSATFTYQGGLLTFKFHVDYNYENPTSFQNSEIYLRGFKIIASSGYTNTLTIGVKNIAKLTDTEKAIATQKGWTLA